MCIRRSRNVAVLKTTKFAEEMNWKRVFETWKLVFCWKKTSGFLRRDPA